MKRKFLDWMVVTLVIAALVGYLALTGRALYLTWKLAKAPDFRPEFLYTTTVLFGLLGGVVAAAFGQKLDEPPHPSSLVSKLRSASNYLFRGFEIPSPNLLTALYAASYFAVSITCVITLVVRDNTPDLVRNIGLAGLGLMVAIVQSFFKAPSPESNRSQFARKSIEKATT